MKPAAALLDRTEKVIGKRPEEVAEKRTPTSKTFDLGNGTFHVAKRLSPIHYFDKGEAKEIDLTLTPSGQCNEALYKSRLLPNRIGYRYTSRRGGWMQIELLTLDGKPVAAPKPRITDNEAWWDDVAPNVSMYFRATAMHPEIFKVYGSARYTTVWKVTQSDDFPGQFNPNTRGKDANGDNLEILTTYETGVFTETWTGRVSRIAERRFRRKEWFTDPLLPALVDASITENIGVGGDDGHAQKIHDNSVIIANPWYPALNSVAMGYNLSAPDSNVTYPGFRFQTVPLPPAAVISSAILTVNVGFVAGVVNLRFFGEDVDSAAAWSDNHRPDQITKTTAFTNSAINAAGLKAIDVTAIVAEIAARPGWASGNMAFGGFPQPTGVYEYGTIEALERGAGEEAQLDITYTVGGGGGATYPPTAGSVPLATPTHWQESEASQLARLANRLEGGSSRTHPVAVSSSLAAIKAIYPALDTRTNRGHQFIYADLIDILTGESVSANVSVEYLLGTLHASLDAYDAA